ncbi:Uncharacterised protein [Escherichia coli]|uniref:Uncharacterized protein n=1 Tax=Escherichia coli TaxID=562 RepID=A0A376Y5J6_ECOLX|nr:Uncharacterised protein [Escherichia coli]
MPGRREMADKFHQNRFCALQSPVYPARHARALPHLFDFTHYRHFLRRGTGMPRLMFLTRGAQAAGFRHAGECDVSDQLQRVRRAILNTGRTVFAPRTKVAFIAVALLFLPRRVSGRFASYQKTGHHAGFTANTLLLIDLNAVINVADCAIRAATGAGRIFTMVTGHCTTLLLMFDNRNSGMKMVLAQDMLLIIVSHDTGDSQA